MSPVTVTQLSDTLRIKYYCWYGHGIFWLLGVDIALLVLQVHVMYVLKCFNKINSNVLCGILALGRRRLLRWHS